MKKEKLVIYREGKADGLFHRGITLFAIITIIALFGMFIALNNMVNTQNALKSCNDDNLLYQNRIAELNTVMYNNCTGYISPLIAVNVTVERWD